MIVPMKKIYMFVQQADVPEALEKLRDFGALHVEALEAVKDAGIIALKEEAESLARAREILTAQKVKLDQVQSGDLPARVQLILKRQALIDELKENNAQLGAKIKYWEEWGNFNPGIVHYLEDRGVYVYLAEIQEADKEKLPEGCSLDEISRKGKVIRCLIASEKKVKLPFATVRLPEDSLELMKATQGRQTAEINDLTIKLKENTRYLDHIEKKLNEFYQRIEFEETAKGMKQDESLSFLKGYCPAKQCEALESKAKEEGWGLLIEEPSDEDNVPTMLENPQWVNLSKPALDLIEVLPGYEEVDVSPVFLYFFTLFFAMLIGDAGYGLVFLGLVLMLKAKLKDKVDPNVIHAGYLFTGATILFGILAGSYFGQAWLPVNVKPVVPWLTDTNNVQWLCFTIALVHLNIARGWAAVNQFPRSTFVAEIGWLSIVWGMYFLANMFVLGTDFPPFGAWLIFGGAALAFFFAYPFNEFTRKAPINVIPFVLGVIGAGTDIISYIRLFAVGLATVAVADAANNMLMEMGGAGGFLLFAILHLLNLILALLAILVHAIRLNVLEFSGHLGLQWAGYKYNPFRMKLSN